MDRKPNVLDRMIGLVAPRLAVQRERARIALDMLRGLEPYEAASYGRRTHGWYRGGATDANVGSAGLSRLRELARDLERNVDLASGVLDQLETDIVGTGIVPTASLPAFKAWSESTQCDGDGRNDLAGLQKLVTRSAWRDGEVLARRRWRSGAGLALPFQVQMLEADYLDTAREGLLANGNRIVQGVEFDQLNQRVAYYLFREHPGSSFAYASLPLGSVRVPASEILHVFRGKRAGAVRGPSPFAPAIGRFMNFETLDDATLTKQLVAACLAVLTVDTDGTAPALGTAIMGTPNLDELYPGLIANVPPGRDVKIVEPPRVNEFGPYSKTVLRRLARAFGMTYEDFTGDYSEVNFSSGRLGRLGYQARSESWRWHVLILQFLIPVWGWATEAAAIAGLPALPPTDWTAPGWPMLEPDKEGLAAQRNIRAGILSPFDAIRERGYDPKPYLQAMAEEWAFIRSLGLVLDSDPSKMTQAGQVQSSSGSGAGASAAAAAGNGGE
jgi:lambda family phage portal protein